MDFKDLIEKKKDLEVKLGVLENEIKQLEKDLKENYGIVIDEKSIGKFLKEYESKVQDLMVKVEKVYKELEGDSDGDKN